MTIKELRDNIDKIDDDNLGTLLKDMYEFGASDGYNGYNDYKRMMKDIIITDYIPIPYEVCEENDNYKKESEE